MPGLSNGEKLKKAVPTGNGIVVDGGSIFAGGTTNSGTISALHTGILLRYTATFTGGVTNSGAISAGGRGIAVGTGSGAAAAGVSTFAGNILNNGKITAATGIAVLGGSTVLGAIVDSGSIVATSHGILIDSASEILAGSKTAIDIAGRTFTGGITNFGVISGSAGIEIASAHPVSIFDAGVDHRHRRHRDRVRRQRQYADARRRLQHQRRRRSLGQQYLPARRDAAPTRSISFRSAQQFNGLHRLSTSSAAPGRSAVAAAPSGWHVDNGAMQVAGGRRVAGTTVSSGGMLVVEVRRQSPTSRW